MLSCSEKFFVGLVCGFLSIDELGPLPEEETRHWPPDEDPWYAFQQILDYASACGLEAFPQPQEVVAESSDDGLDSNSIRWCNKHEILSKEEFESIRDTLIRHTRNYHEALFTDHETVSVLGERFKELTEAKTTTIKGFSPSSPDTVYGLTISGETRAALRSKRLPEGMLRLVLNAVAPHLDSPAKLHMALGISADYDSDYQWWADWNPSKDSVHDPIGKLNRKAATEALEAELIGQAANESYYRIGFSIGQADQLLRELIDWLNLESYRLEHIEEIYARCRMRQNALDQKGNEINSPESEQWADIWEKSIRQLALQAMWEDELEKDHEINQPLAPLQLAAVKKLHASLDSALEIAQQLRLESVISTLAEGRERVESLVKETKAPVRDRTSSRIKRQLSNRCYVIDYKEKMAGVVPLVFGELRMKDVEIDISPAGLSTNALRGWSSMEKNVRDTVREGFNLFQRDCLPYVIINSVSPALEAVVRRLAELHLEQAVGLDLGGLLHRLRDHAKSISNKQLHSAVSIGESLRILRNNANHAPELRYDRNHAAFFLNGLTLLLREV